MPADEPRRLAALHRYQILDTLPEEAFDRLAELAAHICETPIALVSLVDAERQWFKAHIGLAASETPRSLSLCAHAILQPTETLIVPDALADARFQNNALVTGDPHIRFYAGAPLLMPDGFALGTLCVMDTQPRVISARQQLALEALRQGVVSELLLRRRTYYAEGHSRALVEVLQESAREFDPDGLLYKTVQTLMELQRWYSVGISLLTPDRQHWQMRAENRLRPGEVGALFTLDAGVLGRAYRTGQAQLVADTRLDPAFFLAEGEDEIRSELAVPIAHGGRVLGVLNLESRLPNDFEDEDEAFATSIAAALAAALGRRNLESTLRESEARFAKAFAYAAIGMALVSPEGRFLQINRALCDLLGYSENELLAMTFQEITHPADLERDLRYVRQMLAGEIQTYQMEKRYFHKLGQVVWVLLSVSLIRDGAGAPLYFISQIEDVTQYKQTEMKLRASEEKFSKAFMASPDSIVISDLSTGRYLDVNESFLRDTGYARDEIVGFTALEREIWANPADRVRMADAMRTHGFVRDQQAQYRRKSGEIRDAVVSAELIELGDKGQHLLSVVRDITEQVQAQERLRLSEARYRSLVQTQSDLVSRSDLTGRLTFVNDAYCRATGLARSALLGRRFQEFVHPDDLPLIQAVEDTVRLAPHRQYAENRLVLPDGVRWFGWDNSAILDEDGAVIELQGIGRDITERKLAEAELQRSRADLEQAQAIAHLGSWRLDPSSHWEQGEWSKEMYALFDLDPACPCPTFSEFLELIHPEDRDLLLREHRRALETQSPVTFEYRSNPQRGALRYFQATVLVSWAPDGAPPLAGTVLDITAIREATELARESEERHRSLLASLESAVVSIDEDGRFLYVNETAARQMGMLPAALIGTAMTELFPAAVASRQLEDIRQVIRTDQAMVVEAPSLVQGQQRWHRTAIQPVHDRTGRVAYALINSTDIHHLKMAEAALRQQLDVQRVAAQIAQGFVNLAIDNRTEIIQSALASLGQQVGVDRCYIFIYYPEADAFSNMYEWCADGIEPSSSAGRRYSTQDHPLLLQPILRGEVLNFPRVIDLPDGDPAVDIVKAQGVYSVLCLPLIGEKGVLGLIGFDTIAREHPWQEVEVSLLSIVGRIIASGLERLQYEQEILDLNQSLETRVRQRTAEVQDLYDNAPTGYLSLDADGQIIQVNQTALDWLGYIRSELLGRPIKDLLTPESAATFLSDFPVFKQTGSVRDLDLGFVRKDGTILPGLVNALAVYDGDGNYSMSRSTVFDNTERRAAEQALRESEEQNRLLFENTPDAVVLFDRHGRIVRANHAFELLAGFAVEDCVGKSMQAIGLLPDHHLDSLESALVEAVQNQHRFASVEFKITGANGSPRDVGARVFGVTLQGRQHFLTSMRDITLEKQVGETLRLANIEMERALRMKDEFLANMSHELRTPLHGILAMSESLLEQIRGPLNERQQKSVQLIESSGRHLLELINDLLDLSKIEAGKLELQFEAVWIDEICQASLQFVREMALKKEIQVDYANALPGARLAADAKRLKQMLVNLLSNAVKFTPSGGQVRLSVALDPGATRIHFAVQDTGPGIAPADQARLFQPFTQLDSQLARQFEGTGLGLALVKKLAEQHGGTVLLESAGIPGQGSCFTIVLPYEPGLQQPSIHAVRLMSAVGPIAAVPESGPLLLLVEDNEVNIEVLDDFLKHAGYRVVVARTGTEALELAGAVVPDLILMDVQIPVLDGLEVTRRLRTQKLFAATPIIALTASAMTGDRERCLAAGATDYMSKPVRMAELLEMVRRLAEPGC